MMQQIRKYALTANYPRLRSRDQKFYVLLSHSFKNVTYVTVEFQNFPQVKEFLIQFQQCLNLFITNNQMFPFFVILVQINHFILMFYLNMPLQAPLSCSFSARCQRSLMYHVKIYCSWFTHVRLNHLCVVITVNSLRSLVLQLRYHLSLAVLRLIKMRIDQAVLYSEYQILYSNAILARLII